MHPSRNPLANVELPVATERLLLDRLTERLSDEHVRLMGDRRVSRWLIHIPYPYRPEDYSDYLRIVRRGYRRRERLSLALLDRSRKRLVGGVGLRWLDWTDRNAELGYWIAHPYWGRGFASEAVAAALEIGFGTLALHKIDAATFNGNVRSQNVLRKAGFRPEGVRREVFRSGGRWLDDVLFGLTVGEWRRRRRRTKAAAVVRTG